MRPDPVGAPMTVDETSADVLTAYRIRTVRVAVMVTVLALGCLTVLPFLPGHPHMNGLLYGLMLALAAVGVSVAAVLPWPRLFAAGWGERLMYLWSALDIALVTLGAALTGGPRSDVGFFYALTTLFFAARPTIPISLADTMKPQVTKYSSVPIEPSSRTTGKSLQRTGV